MKKSQYGILLAGAAAMMWGVSGPMSQLLFATDHVSVHWLIASKMILAGIIVVAGGFLTQKDKMLGIWRSWHTILALLAFTAVGMVSMQFIYYQAIAVSDAATATILQFMSPILVVVYLAFAEHKLPSRIDMSAVVLAILGTYLIVTRGHIGHLAVTPVGLFWGIAAAFAAAVYTLGPRNLIREFGAISTVGWSMLIGGIAMAPTVPAQEWIPHLSTPGLLAYLFILIFGTVIAYAMYLGSLRFTNATVVSVLDSFEPLGAAILSVVMFNRHFSIAELLGILLIIMTVVGMSFLPQRNVQMAQAAARTAPVPPNLQPAAAPLHRERRMAKP
ncbi:EamA family transporter [Schleiferilactobacillus harbinensis]|jgi:drug/metabolite transporter (DMT)-like permease|uniref:EamA family transporter n=2 Tax=Schleiferilactobacillus harbinensis TaxID=304207 RepID=A0ABU7SXB8_9LACO|nr:EamA family transporter [Schleiferilactobacillus harbinensis]KRM28649.1 drug metabolite transporter superfamily permease [Schleiferilactobacillus harbinensis DSM 16991]MBO3091276.1 EamA family transporter [Schleiferilactobacillus harbinensis]MCT2909390.1 peptide ABC transporter permease [Schleiferilactobacillus harbinensis]QEU47195.1 EamA family transporter [Schleiferilactobacillus harbinensis]QFR62746.1 EamA family transporter [Schleiferilactobacillus harbinensis]